MVLNFERVKACVCTLCVLIISCFMAQAQDSDPKLNEIQQLIMKGNHQKAIEESNKLIRERGDSTILSMAYSYAGIANQELGNNTEAIKLYKHAILYNVPRLDIYEMMINLTNKVKDNHNFEFALLQQKKAFPDFEKTVEQKLAAHYFKSKQYDKLLQSGNKLIDWFPEEGNYRYFKAVAYQNKKEIDKAIEAHKEALELNSDHLNANLALGMILYKKGTASFKTKKKKYESLKSPTRLDYDKYRKSLESSKKMYEESLRYILKAYEIKPNDKLKPVLANIYMRLDKKAEAVKYQ